MRFDRFMARALYDAEGGYYSGTAEPIGRAGDYFTSVSVGSLFGELLGFTFAGLLDQLPDETAPTWLVEAGAHDGRLAEDILGWLRDWRPAQWPRVNYGIVEPSAAWQAIQRRRLGAFEGKMRWFGSLAELTACRLSGVLFLNELLDALPLRRLVWRRNGESGRWVESAVGISSGDECLAWSEREVAVEEWQSGRWLGEERDRLRELEPVLPTGFVWEHPVGAIEWWAEAAKALAQGWLVAIDYGRRAASPVVLERPDGTLRAFRRHHQAARLLANPGGQDLTADVDFDVIRRVGEAAGLATMELRSLAEWLTGTLGRVEASIVQGGFPAWTPARRRQLLTLVHPEHLGTRFQVLVQTTPSPPTSVGAFVLDPWAGPRAA